MPQSGGLNRIQEDGYGGRWTALDASIHFYGQDEQGPFSITPTSPKLLTQHCQGTSVDIVLF